MKYDGRKFAGLGFSMFACWQFGCADVSQTRRDTTVLDASKGVSDVRKAPTFHLTTNVKEIDSQTIYDLDVINVSRQEAAEVTKLCLATGDLKNYELTSIRRKRSSDLELFIFANRSAFDARPVVFVYNPDSRTILRCFVSPF